MVTHEDDLEAIKRYWRERSVSVREIPPEPRKPLLPLIWKALPGIALSVVLFAVGAFLLVVVN